MYIYIYKYKNVNIITIANAHCSMFVSLLSLRNVMSSDTTTSLWRICSTLLCPCHRASWCNNFKRRRIQNTKLQDYLQNEMLARGQHQCFCVFLLL